MNTINIKINTYAKSAIKFRGNFSSVVLQPDVVTHWSINVYNHNELKDKHMSNSEWKPKKNNDLEHQRRSQLRHSPI